MVEITHNLTTLFKHNAHNFYHVEGADGVLGTSAGAFGTAVGSSKLTEPFQTAPPTAKTIINQRMAQTNGQINLH